MSDESKERPSEPEVSDKMRERLSQAKDVMRLGFGKLFEGVQKVIFHKEEEVLYDDGSEGQPISGEAILTRVIYAVFAVYGIVAGFLMQNYAASLILQFSAWAAGVDITSSRIPSSPLTIIASIIIVGVVYLAGLVLEGLIYMLFKKLAAPRLYDGLQTVQIGFMYGILLIIVFTILGILLPVNVFL